jgi:serine phosphatase RsbU (regulator of sigma subunit)
MTLLDEPSESIGIRSWTKPVITEMPLSPHTYVIVFTDGVLHAGRRCGHRLDVRQLLRDLIPGAHDPSHEPVPAQVIADALLARAVACDEGRPADDISVLVIAVMLARPEDDDVRRMSVRFPMRVKGTS